MKPWPIVKPWLLATPIALLALSAPGAPDHPVGPSQFPLTQVPNLVAQMQQQSRGPIQVSHLPDREPRVGEPFLLTLNFQRALPEVRGQVFLTPSVGLELLDSNGAARVPYGEPLVLSAIPTLSGDVYLWIETRAKQADKAHSHGDLLRLTVAPAEGKASEN